MNKDASVPLALVRSTARYYWSKRRYRALARSMWLTVARRCGMELCQFCGGRYTNSANDKQPFPWWAPSVLWAELVNPDGHGFCCPGCFNRLAKDAGYRLMWTALRWQPGDDILGRVNAVYAESARAVLVEAGRTEPT